jgi:hypothetical protein
MGNLTNQRISASFQSLLQIEGDGRVTDGLGAQPSSFILSDITGSFSGSFQGLINSASYALTASYAENSGGGGGAGFPFSGSGVVTGSILVSGSDYSINIGEPEDGTYTDGLFTDFTWNTGVGTVVDRFNEVLKALAPSPAPAVGDADLNSSGTTVKLSFGPTKTIAGYTDATVEVGNDRGSIGLNGTFTVGGSVGSTDLRYGAFSTIAARVGTINESVVSDGSPSVNYPANSFGDANLGSLELYVNNTSTPVLTMDLTTTLLATSSVNANGSQLSVTAADDAHFPATGDALDVFKHRQGTYTVGTSDQQTGYNYAYVVHNLGGSTPTTNFVDWVNDTDGNALSVNNEEMKEFTPAGSNKISGVDYYTSATIKFAATASNAYRNVYSTSGTAVDFTATNLSQTGGTVNITGTGINDVTGATGDEPLPTLNTNANAEQEDINIETSLSFNANLYAPDDNAVMNVTVKHPLKSNASSTTSNFNDTLIYKTTSNTDTDVETFLHESNRLIPAVYTTQAAADTGNAWSSTQNVNTGDANHNTGLIVVPFDSGRLVKPAYTGNGVTNGNFSAVTNGPGSNADYSSLTSTTTERTHYFKLQNTTTSDLSQFTLSIKGSGTAVLATTVVGSMTGNNFKIEFKCPERTGWLDCVKPRSAGLNNDGDGGLVGGSFTQPTAGGTTNQISVNVAGDACRGTAAGDKLITAGEYLVFRITAREDWSGYIDEIEITEF